ncbi:MAG: hypothetical protein Q9181_007160 [Wetmoreana brouardii]
MGRDITTDAGSERGSRRLSTARLYNQNVTFEEYYYYALQSRTHPSESTDNTSTASTTGMSKYNPFRRVETPADSNGTVNEKGSNDPNGADAWHDVSNEEYVQASRALRTAGWGAVFYLITTDILGPFTTGWAFSQMGYGPAAVLYFIFACFAA